MSNQKIYSATIFFAPEKQTRPRKYSFVRSLPGFVRFATDCGGVYLNLYDKPTGKFLRRIWL